MSLNRDLTSNELRMARKSLKTGLAIVNADGNVLSDLLFQNTTDAWDHVRDRLGNDPDKLRSFRLAGAVQTIEVIDEPFGQINLLKMSE